MSNPIDPGDPESAFNQASSPLLGDELVGVGGLDEGARRRRRYSLAVFLIILVGVFGFLIYSSVSILHDATTSNYGWQDIQKPTNDQKIYKYLGEIVPDGPPIVMVQDTGAQITGYAIGVSAGYYYDPMDFPGLAHFTEHMLFLGTSKFPNPTDYDEYLTSHGGSSNAFTDSEKTVYYNSIDTDAFSEGFTRFAQFFAKPNFNSTYIAKEVNAVDSEHAMHMNDPHWRMFSIVANLSLPPANHYSTGDSSTLLGQGTDALREAVVKYYSANYCFNRLAVSVVSPLAISDQIEIVREVFNSLSLPLMANNCKTPTNFTKISSEIFNSNGWPIPRWNRQKFVYSAAPAGAAPNLWVLFPYRAIESSPADAGKHPYGIIETILTYSGPDSFKSTVLEKGLATSVSFMFDDTSAGSVGYLSFQIGEASSGRIGDLLELTFSYLNKIRSEPVSTSFIQQLQSVREKLWLSSTEAHAVANESPMRLAKYFASKMSSMNRNRTEGNLHAPDLVRVSEAILTVDTKLVNDILSQFTPNNSVVVVHDPKYVSAAVPEYVFNIANYSSWSTLAAVVPEQIDAHYNFSYRVLNISDETAGVWGSSTVAANLTVLSNIVVGEGSVGNSTNGPVQGWETGGTSNSTTSSSSSSTSSSGSPEPFSSVPSVSAPPTSRVNTTHVLAPPELLMSGFGTELWYKDTALAKSSDQFWLWATIRPSASAAFGMAPEEVQFNGELVVDCVNVELRSKLADYVLSGYDFGVSWMFAGYYELHAHGWNEQRDSFVRTILDELSNPSLDYFDLVLQEKQSALARTKGVAELAGESMNALTVGSATAEDLVRFANTYTPTKDGLRAWVAQVFGKTYSTVYVAGAASSLPQQDALNLGQLFGAGNSTNVTINSELAANSTVADPGTTGNSTVADSGMAGNSTVGSITNTTVTVSGTDAVDVTSIGVTTDGGNTTAPDSVNSTSNSTITSPADISSNSTAISSDNTIADVSGSTSNSSITSNGTVSSAPAVTYLNSTSAVHFLAGPRFAKPVEIRTGNPDPTDPNSALLYSLTFGSDMTLKERILTSLLSSVLGPLVFRYIRTEHQMGYIASCRTGVYPGPAGAVQLRVFIQGNQADPDAMEARLEELFAQVPGILADLPLSDVADRASGVAASLEEIPTSAPAEAFTFWSEIQDETPCFQRAVNQAKFLETTDAATLKQGIIDVFTLFTVTRRSKVTVKVWKSDDGITPASPGAWNATEITNLLNNTSVSIPLSGEKGNTLFAAGVSKVQRELIFQKALNTTDPLWESTTPSCDV